MCRRATILDERLKEGTDIFIIQAKLPVVESFGMVSDHLKQTPMLTYADVC